MPPDWSLIKELIRQVHNAPGSGLHRAHLAAIVRLPAHGPCIRDALMIAYKLRKIDFCGQYVVKSLVTRQRRTFVAAGQTAHTTEGTTR